MALVVIPDEEEDDIELPVLQISGAVLPANYPLFDWANWPESRAALVPGCPTKKFEKACWNAIIDTLAKAVEAAGFDFYDAEKGFSENDLKMTKGYYGRLTADRMNATVAAVNNLVPMKWIWNNDQSRCFGTYTQERFHGLTNPYGFSPSVVYPEYILDLARKVNMFIEFMRDTYPYVQQMSAHHLTDSFITTWLRMGISRAISWRRLIRTTVSETVMQVGVGLPTSLAAVSRLSVSFTPELLHAGTLHIPMHTLYMPVSASAEVKAAATLFLRNVRSLCNVYPHLEAVFPTGISATARADSLTKAEMAQTLGTPIAGALLNRSAIEAHLVQQIPLSTESKMLFHIHCSVPGMRAPALHTGVAAHSCSLTQAAAALSQPVCTEARQRSGTKSRAEANTGILTACGAAHQARSAMGAQVHTAGALPTSVGHCADTSAGIAIIKGRPRPGWAEQRSGSRAEASVDMTQPSALGVKQKSGLSVICSIGTAWEAPVWHDGGLWIRQARTIKIRADGSMDLSGSGDPIAAAQSSATMIVCTLDTAWLPPVWQNGGLYIRQVREVKVLEDGSLDLSGAGDELGAAHKSRTNIACTLDTAWHPPVMVDAGLYIRQVQEAVQNENGELEVM